MRGQNARGKACPGHVEDEIMSELVARYLRIGSGRGLGNKLSQFGLKFRELKKETLANVTN